ncbi:hypothetical protein ScPMuIL_013068 [Solemya velum]
MLEPGSSTTSRSSTKSTKLYGQRGYCLFKSNKGSEMKLVSIVRAFNGMLPAILCLNGCGRWPGKRKRPQNMTPLVYKQHVPNAAENTLGSSGVSEGKIERGDQSFKDLVTNNNPNIMFKDEEGDGSDRIMSQGCKDRLNTLSVYVMNQWMGVKLRVTEGWDNDGHHAKESLHYEGRAVDITTSDRDRAKYGMLARLAVEAGFDWVYYESRGHIHCSVKSDNSITARMGGCFPGSSNVLSETGEWKMLSDISVGEHVLSMAAGGILEFSEVIAFLDKNPVTQDLFHTIMTDDGHHVSLTAKHLIYISETNNTFGTEIDSLRAVYAENVEVGQYVYFADGDFRTMKPLRIVNIKLVSERGIYAPLTKHGTIVVDGFVASCYANINNINLAHFALMPMRLVYDISKYISFWLDDPIVEDYNVTEDNRVHWYARFLINIGKMVLSRSTLFVP